MAVVFIDAEALYGKLSTLYLCQLWASGPSRLLLEHIHVSDMYRLWGIALKWLACSEALELSVDFKQGKYSLSLYLDREGWTEKGIAIKGWY